MSTKIPVLMYHAIEDDDNPCGSTDIGEQVYVIDLETFKAQMEYLFENGYQSINSLDLLSKKPFPDKAVAIGFDDGHASCYTLALPVLEKYGYTADIFMTTDWIGKPNYLSEIQLNTLHKSGIVIGSHGTSHRFLSDLSPDAAYAELSASKDILSSITGQTTDVFAAPGGRYNDYTIQSLKDLDYQIGYTSDMGVYTETTNLLTIPRIAIKRNTRLNEFKKIVARDPVYVSRQHMISAILGFTKKVLGNNLYVLLRGKLLPK